MDRRTVVAIVLSLAIYYGWLMLRGPQAAEDTDPTVTTTEAPAPVVPAPVVPAPVAVPSDLPLRQIPFAACGSDGLVSTDGGALSALRMREHTGPYHTMPLYQYVLGLFTGQGGSWKPYGDPPGPAELLSDHAAALAVGAGPSDRPLRMAVVEEAPGRLVLAGRTPEGVEITRTLAEKREGERCVIEVEATWRNTSGAAFTGPTWIANHDRSGHASSRYQSQRQPMALVDGDLTYGGDLGAGCVRAGTQLSDTMPVIELPGPPSWFGLSNRYFGFFAVPRGGDSGALQLDRLGAGEAADDGVRLLVADALAPGASRSQHLEVYAGPNHIEALDAVDPLLPRAVDLGWFAVFGYPLLWLLRQFHSLTDNWGLSIILLTVVVKTVFFPMTQRSFKSMQRMQEIQPELNKIREEFADNPQELNRRTMELMTSRQVNPLSGCLPTVVQMPVWFALYQVLLSNVELYHSRFLYLQDLSEPDPYMVLPITITALMWLQQQFTPVAANMDPVQQRVMKFMPLMFGLLFFAFPSGLAVYVFVNMALSILQQWLIRRTSGSPPAVVPTAA